MICSPCVPSLAATKKVLMFNGQPEIIFVYVSYMEYGRTHKHCLRLPGKRKTTFGEIKHCLPTPRNRIRRVVLFKFG